MKRVSKLLSWISLVVALASSPAEATTIGFEGLTDGTSVGSYYAAAGVVFNHASVLTSGISLNEVEFPPHSGQNVVGDDGGPITISFTGTVTTFGAYFTYATPLQLIAYDALNNQIGSISSLYSGNYTSSGNAPNETLLFNYASGIRSITIAGDPGGGSFVMDDLSFSGTLPPAPTPVPEPNGLWLLGMGTVIIFCAARAQAYTGIGSGR